jgi:hypothetical protein
VTASSVPAQRQDRPAFIGQNCLGLPRSVRPRVRILGVD